MSTSAHNRIKDIGGPAGKRGWGTESAVESSAFN
jgi:hypothetical protein